MKSNALLLITALSLFPSAAYALDDQEGPGDEEPTPTTQPSGPATPPPPAPAWSKSYSPGAYVGNSNWGAGWALNGRLAAYPKTTVGTRDKLEASASLNAYARLNGSNYSMFRVEASGVTQAKYRTDLGFTAYVGGAAIYTKSYSSATSTYVPLSIGQTWPRTFVDKSVTVAVGPIPVTFRVQATGQVGASLTGKISNVGIEMAAGPSGKASLFASAAVGGQYCVWTPFGDACVGATAGLSIDLTLLEASAPTNLAVWWSLAGPYGGVLLNYLATSNITLKSLGGHLDVFAEGCIGGCLSWDSTLVEWPGATATWWLFNVNGKYCLTGQCTDGFQ
jgi:hypothetical protein